ncbi:hypothetical protein QFZ51_002631 [Chitinophaga sp. W3I9]
MYVNEAIKELQIRHFVNVHEYRNKIQKMLSIVKYFFSGEVKTGLVPVIEIVFPGNDINGHILLPFNYSGMCKMII